MGAAAVEEYVVNTSGRPLRITTFGALASHIRLTALHSSDSTLILELAPTCML